MDEPGADPEAQAADSEDLDDLVGDALEALESGGAAALNALLGAHPGRADAVRSRLARLDQLGLLDSSVGADVPDRVGEFAIEDVLAEGGMGVVYRARDESLGRAVALKVVRPELLLVPGARARIRREAEAAAQLSHPNVAALHRYGEHDGLPYLAMELVEGRSLAQVLDAVGGPDAPEPDGAQLIPTGPSAWTAACLQVGAEVARALAHAHGRGVLHRDVKPSNILVDEAGKSRLVDFGLARMEGGGQLTRTGSQVGSLYYMAPEQLLERSAELDGRVDVYALGVTLYELLTRSSPFAGHPPEETIRRIREGQFERPRRVAPHLSRDVEAVLLQAMAVDRERRYADAEALADELDNLLAFRPVVARRPTAAVRMRAWTRRHPRLATAVLLTVVSGLAMGVVVDWQQRESRRDLAVETSRTSAQTEALGELLAELGLMLDEAMLSQDGERMERIHARIDSVAEHAAVLPAAGTGDSLAVAQSRLTLAAGSLAAVELERTAEHLAVAREALGNLEADASLPLVFRAHVLLAELARLIDDVELRRSSWADAQAAFAALEAGGRVAMDDRLRFLIGVTDEAALARAGGNLAVAVELLALAERVRPPAPATRAARLAVARNVVEAGRADLALRNFDRVRVAAARAAELLDGVLPDTAAVRATVIGLARLESELYLATGDPTAASARLEAAAPHLVSSPETRFELETQVRFLDLRLRLSAAHGDESSVDRQMAAIESTAMDLLERYGQFELSRSVALQALSNVVSLSDAPARIERGLRIGRSGLEAWRTVAAEGEAVLSHAQLLLNLGALEQDTGRTGAAAASFAAADAALQRARESGRSDKWLDRTQLAILTNRGVLHATAGETEPAERVLTRARALSRSIVERSDVFDDWLRHARVAQELANVHMDTPRNAHSIAVLEASLAELDAFAARVELAPAIADERDWQCFSLMTQYLQVGGEERAHGLLRTLLERGTRDAELAAQFALVSAYAVRPEHGDAALDRALCQAWIAAATELDPTFPDAIDLALAPWDRLAAGE